MFSKSLRSPLFAFAECLLVLPAAALAVLALLRSFQPRQFEPAHTAWLFFQWTASHISRFDAGVIFLALPALVCFAGFASFANAWRENRALRDDLLSVLAILRRHITAVFVACAASLAAAILLLVGSHIITD